jgi:GNAT superfamily N-acetyltransferase
VYHPLGEGRLATGERLALGVVDAPDPAWSDRIVPFLIHKGGDWNYQIAAAMKQPLDDLETRFYVGTVDEQIVTQVMIAGARGCGILSHVFTAPAWRQRGAYRQLMAAQMADTRARGYRILTLGTGYNSHPYWIYHSFGFRSVAEGSGYMRWEADPGATEAYLAPSDAMVRPSRWDDWAGYMLAMLQPVHPGESLPRSPALGAARVHSVEGPFIGFRRGLDRVPGMQSLTLQSTPGAVVGWCHVVPGPAVFGDAWLLDLHTLPGFADQARALLEPIVWPAAPVAYVSDDPLGAFEALSSAVGFRKMADLPRFLALGGHGKDLRLWVRSAEG